MKKTHAVVQWIGNSFGRKKYSIIPIVDFIENPNKLKSENEYIVNYNRRKLKAKLIFVE